MAGRVLAIYYKKESVRILKEFHLPTVIEAFSLLVKICGEKIHLVLVFHSPRQQESTSIDGIISIFIC